LACREKHRWQITLVPVIKHPANMTFLREKRENAWIPKGTIRTFRRR